MADLVGYESETEMLSRPPESSVRPVTLVRQMADAVRAFVVEAGDSGPAERPVLPLAMADVATVLWTRFHKFDAADPHWPDRDRFVLSPGHGSLLLYAPIYLTADHGLSIDDTRNFRQLHTPAAGHPEYGEHPAIETTTGPLGQGISTAVGMPIAERLLRAPLRPSRGPPPHT